MFVPITALFLSDSILQSIRRAQTVVENGLYRLELNEQFIGKGKIVGRDHLDSCLREDFEFYLQPKTLIKTWWKAMGLSINGGKILDINIVNRS